MVPLHSSRCRLGDQLNDVAERESLGNRSMELCHVTRCRLQDGSGGYKKKWCPELSKLPKAVLHKPWEAPTEGYELRV